jgi:uncharacterized protein (TIGR03663 family)
VRFPWRFFLFSVLIFISRFYFLENKPLHFDEGINGWFVLQMQKTGFYQYNPLNFHGPLYFYLLRLWMEIFGQSIFTLRSLPALISAAFALFFWRRLPWMGLLLLISPAFIFYGRSGIHETAFVFAQGIFFWGLWDFKLRERLISLWWVGLGLLGMITLKETFTITLFCGFLVMISCAYPLRTFLRSLVTMKYPILFFVFAWALLFSGFGHNPDGLRDFFVAFTPWLKTGAEGHGHEKPFTYWLILAAQTEPLLLVAVLAAFLGLFRPWRMVACFALLQGLAYSWIPYKTPWCFITIAWPFYFVLGLYLQDIWKKKGILRLLMILILAVCSVGQVRQLWISVYRDPIDLNHPLVYVNSTYEFKALNGEIMRELEQKPALRNQVIQISLRETWPLPWTLQNSQGLRYDSLRKNYVPGAWIYFCDASDDELLQSKLGEEVKNYRRTSLRMRQSTLPISVWCRTAIPPEESK